jgi:hypothetical protein
MNLEPFVYFPLFFIPLDHYFSMNPFIFLPLFLKVLFVSIFLPQSVDFTFLILDFLVSTLLLIVVYHQESSSKFSNQ